MILGLDISSSITGVCWIDCSGNYVDSTYLKFKKTDDAYDKCDIFSKKMLNSNNNKDLKFVFVERSLLGFMSGATSQKTIIKLTELNSKFRYIVYDKLKIKPVEIATSTIKAQMKCDGLIIPKVSKKERTKVKKTKTLEFCRKNIKNFFYEETKFGNPQKYCYDIADAYCVARSGFKKYLKNKKWKKN